METGKPEFDDVAKRLSELQREKEALLDRLQAERTRSAALLKVVEMIQELRSRQRLFDQALEKAMELTGAEAGSIIMVREEDPSALRFESARGEKAADLSNLTFRIGEGIAGWVVENGIAQIIPDAGKDERFLQSLANQIGYQVNNALCVPFRQAGTVVGAIELLNKSAGRAFNALDVEVAEILASNVGKLLQVAKDLAVGET
jgi:GAF domain-containing protein